MRENRVTQSVLNVLNSRLNAYEDDGNTIRLTTHNAQSDSVNIRKLDDLPGEMRMFEADIEGDFPENIYPADFVLSLKEGAQVMFIRNDSEGEYYNGKLGKVVSIKQNYLVSRNYCILLLPLDICCSCFMIIFLTISPPIEPA